MFEHYSRRSFLAGATACAALAGLDGHAQSKKIQSRKHRRPAEDFTIKLVTGSDSTGARQILIDAWNQANPDAQIAVEFIVGNARDQYQRMRECAQNSTADIINLDITYITEFASRGWLRALETRPANDSFLERPLAACRYRDAYYARPFNSDVGMLLSAGQATGVDLRTLLQDPTRRWIAQLDDPEANSGEAFVCNVLEHAIAIDPDLVTRDPTRPGDPCVYHFESGYADRWNRALTPLRDAIAANRVVRAAGEDDANARFAQGQAPYLRNWPINYQVLTTGAHRIGACSITPLGRGILGGQNLAIVKTSTHPTIASKVIDFLTGHLAQVTLALHGFAPTTAYVYGHANAPALRIPHLGTIRGAIENSFTRPQAKSYERFSDTFHRLTKDFLLSGNALTGNAMNELQASIEE